MAAKISVLGLKLSSYPYLRSAMVRFPLWQNLVRQTKKIKFKEFKKSNLNTKKKNCDIITFTTLATLATLTTFTTLTTLTSVPDVTSVTTVCRFQVGS